MIEGVHLAEALEKEKPEYIKGKINLIVAKTGQGKTTAAQKIIPKQLGITNFQRCLILIDTLMGQEEKILMGECQRWGEKENKPYILNYNQFAAMIKRKEINAQMFDYIACDEIHNLIKYVRIDEATTWKRNSDYDYETICLLLSRESLSYIAIDTLLRWMELQDVWVFGLTATPENVEKWHESKKYIHNIQIKEQLLAYEVFNKYEYGDVSFLLKSNPEVKRLIFVPTITLGEKFLEEITNTTNRKVALFFSKTTSSNKKMSPLDCERLNYLTTYHRYPSDIDDIITTEAYATGWNLIDDDVQIVIVHSGNKDIQIQFPGRKRGDWQIQYNYNSQLAENDRRAARKLTAARKERQEIANQDWIIPEKFLGVRLTKKEKDALIQEIHYPKKWTSLKKDISNKYNVEQKGTGVNYCHIITKK